MEKKASKGFGWVYWVALAVAVAVLGAGVYLAITVQAWAILAVGCACVVGVLITWPLAAQLKAYHLASYEQTERALSSINERFEQFSVMLNMISEQQLLSDRAKSVAFRDKDSDALRRAIQDEILEQHWEAAISLANEIEKSFGYIQEADALRARIAEKQQEIIRKQVHDAATLVDRHIRGEAWAEAFQEANRIARQYPDHQQAASMPGEVEHRRDAHKQALIDAWNDSVTRHDVDGAIEILKRLDGYLTPTEAEAYQESARGIFKEKLGNLRTQFSLAVQDRNWNEALRLADSINSEFPNTQMAKEVREMMSSLRARASGLEPAEV